MGILDNIVGNPIFKKEKDWDEQQQQQQQQQIEKGRQVVDEQQQAIKDSTSTQYAPKSEITDSEVTNVGDNLSVVGNGTVDSKEKQGNEPIMQETREEVVNNHTPTTTTTTEIEEEIPQGVDPIKYKRLVDNFGKERVNAWYASDKDVMSSVGMLEELYKHSKRMPDPPSEREIKRRETIAGIGDSLSLLAQMFASSKGAHMRERKAEDNASTKLNKRLYDLQKLYKSHETEYNRGLDNARMQDFNRRIQNRDNGLAKAQDYLYRQDRQLAENELKRDALRFKNELDRDKLEETKRNNEFSANLKGGNLGETKRNNDLKNEIAKERLALDRDKLAQQERLAQARIDSINKRLANDLNKGGGSGKASNKSTVVSLVPPSNYLGKTTKDAIGADVVNINVDNALANRLITEAKMDEDFDTDGYGVAYEMKIGDTERKWADDVKIVNAYLNYLFKNGTPEQLKVMQDAIDNYNNNIYSNQQREINRGLADRAPAELHSNGSGENVGTADVPINIVGTDTVTITDNNRIVANDNYNKYNSIPPNQNDSIPKNSTFADTDDDYDDDEFAEYEISIEDVKGL